MNLKSLRKVSLELYIFFKQLFSQDSRKLQASYLERNSYGIRYANYVVAVKVSRETTAHANLYQNISALVVCILLLMFFFFKLTSAKS